MIHLVTPENDFHYRDEMEQAYRLRHQVFVEEMGWHNLAKPEGREIDQFDNKHAVHMLDIEHGEVLGYQRLLPTTRPHLLSDIMPELCEVERQLAPIFGRFRAIASRRPSVRRTLRESDCQRPWIGLARMGP